MRIRLAVPDRHISPEVLNAALEATTVANEAMLASGEVGPISDAIRAGSVKWKPEPFKDGEHFDLSSVIQERGWADCDDLAPALAAELRESGIDPDARAVVKKSGPKRWHAVTELSSGRILDPSAMAGMYEYKKKHGDVYVNGPGEYGIIGSSVVPSLSLEGENVLGIKRHGGGWASRCDLPIDGSELSIVGVAVSADAVSAICGAVNAASVVGAAGGYVHPEEIAKAIAIREALSGTDPELVAEMLSGQLDGEDVIGIFGGLMKGLRKVASPLAKIAKFVPIPGVSAAAQAANSLLQKTAPKARPPATSPATPLQAPIPGAPGLAAWAPAPPTVQAPQGPSGPVIVKF